MQRALAAAVVMAMAAACRGCDHPAPAADAGVAVPDAGEDAGPAAAASPEVDEPPPDELGALPEKPARSTVTYASRRYGKCALYADDLLARHPVRLTNPEAECPSYAVDRGGALLLWHERERNGPVTWVRFRPRREEVLPPPGNALDANDYGFVRGAPAAVATGPLLPSHPKTMMAEMEDGGIEELPVPDDMERAVVLRLDGGEWKIIATRDYEPGDDDDGVSDLLDPEDLGPRTTRHDFVGIGEREDVEDPLPRALKARTGRFDEDMFIFWEQFKLSGVRLYQKTHRGSPAGPLLWRTPKGTVEEVPGCDAVRRLTWNAPWLACDDQVIDLRTRAALELDEADDGLLFVHREE
ncbi:MAG TPA: hypothetical protein VFA20_04500 [Myxococcaceae bacterium]|nr:hypothetical protein [Myxococcaceae bacterium]